MRHPGGADPDRENLGWGQRFVLFGAGTDLEFQPGNPAEKAVGEYPGEPKKSEPDRLQLPEGGRPPDLQQGVSSQGRAFPLPLVREASGRTSRKEEAERGASSAARMQKRCLSYHLLTEIPKHMDGTNQDFLEALLPWPENLPQIYYKKSEYMRQNSAQSPYSIWLRYLWLGVCEQNGVFHLVL